MQSPAGSSGLQGALAHASGWQRWKKGEWSLTVQYRDLDDDAVRACLEAILESACTPTTKHASNEKPGGAPNEQTGSPVVVGQVRDTHHPHRPGRVLVAFLDETATPREEWLHCERNLRLTRGDRVLVTLPLGWTEWLVTGALSSPVRPVPEDDAVDTSPGASGTPMQPVSEDDAASPTADSSPAREAPSNAPPQRAARWAQQLRLEPGEALQIVSHDGRPLLTLRQGSEGPVLELAGDCVELAARRVLRLSGDTVEIRGGAGGVDLRTEGDAVFRAYTIRLN